MKKWLSELINGVLQNILATILITISISTIGIIYAFSTNNPQTTLLIVIIVLVVINTISNLFLIRQHNSLAKSLEELSKFKCELATIDNTKYKTDPDSEKFQRAFEIVDKYFDEASSPQKLEIHFMNRGHAIIQVTRVKYSSNQLPKTAISTSYKIENIGDYIIPFKQSDAGISPGKKFVVEICLEQIWKSENINGLSGRWGYLRIEAIYNDKPVELFTSF